MPISNLLIDDRLLVSVLTGAKVRLPGRRARATTMYWYYRACRAAMTGGRGRLSAPFAVLDEGRQAEAIHVLLALPDEIALADPRELVPVMVDVHTRHPRLNILNIEVVAAARLLDAEVALSPPATNGVLPFALDAEGIAWREIGPT